jgi:hypothetical protein
MTETAATPPSRWRKSSYSGGNNECLEVAALVTGGIGVRDSKAPEGPVLAFGAGAWQAFVEEAQGHLTGCASAHDRIVGPK